MQIEFEFCNNNISIAQKEVIKQTVHRINFDMTIAKKHRQVAIIFLIIIK